MYILCANCLIDAQPEAEFAFKHCKKILDKHITSLRLDRGHCLRAKLIDPRRTQLLSIKLLDGKAGITKKKKKFRGSFDGEEFWKESQIWISLLW